MRLRIEQEWAFLRQHFGAVEHAEADGEDWFRLPRYGLPAGWHISNQEAAEIPIVFLVTAAYPGSAPYGFLGPIGLTFNGTGPGNTGAPPKVPPFAGDWIHFSWSADSWMPTDVVRKGSNLLVWSRSFKRRFEEGV